MAQIPPEASGFAAGILAYSFFCLFSSLFLFVLVWIHNERTSYVSLLSFSVSLSTLASITQQIHTIVLWDDIKTAQFEHQVANVGNPELNIAGGSVGLDLALFYIQFYTYNVEATLVLLWAVELAKSIFQLRSFQNSRTGKRAQLVAKGFAVLFPVLQTGLLQSDVVQRDYNGFMILANILMFTSMLTGTLLLLVILIKYVHTRRSLLSWNVQYGQPTDATNKSQGTAMSSGTARIPRQKGIYDKWLVVRFSIAFVMLASFQLVTILFEILASRTNDVANLQKQPDLSGTRAKADFILFVPGVTPSLVSFIVFGTTRAFRDYIWKTFIPRRFRQKYEEKQRRRRMPSVVIPRLQPPPKAINTTITINKRPRDNLHRVGTFYSDTDSCSPRTPLTPFSITFGDIGLQVLGRRHTEGKMDDEWPILTNSALSRVRLRD